MKYLKRRLEMLKKFELRDIILIAILAALSIVTKPMIKSISALAVGSMGLPNGLVGGMIYMMWLTLIFRFVRKPFSVIVFSAIQGILAMLIMGMPPLGIASYIASGIGAELVLLPLMNKPMLPVNILAGAVANTFGAIIYYYLFFGKAVDPLPIIIVLSLLSGGLSGFLTSFIYGRVKTVWKPVQSRS
jgi:ABC-type thiamin/hydroxymethylpyrimidine transport system permease subunit